MGLFDYRCMISGVSLATSRTALVLLEKTGDDYTPISLPVYGYYNRIGAIDRITEDESTAKILEFFQSKVHSGEVTVDWKEAYWKGRFLDRIETIEQLIACIERGVTMDYDSIVLNGKRIVYALVDYTIWDAVTYDDSENNESVFIESETWKEIYKYPISFYGNYIHEFKNTQNFLKKYRIKWLPPADAHQHTDEEIKDFLKDAKLEFREEERLKNAILAYEKELEWIRNSNNVG